MYRDFSPAVIDDVMQEAWQAFHVYRTMSLQARAHFMRTIAAKLATMSDELIRTAMEETHLPAARLRTEITRTLFQWESYAAACEEGTWLDISIDTALLHRQPPRPDLRKMLVPLGPVVVFGASNFPFAYATAGGDTASALAAGCPVVVKAHPAHPKTSELSALAIQQAAEACDMPKGIIQHVHGLRNPHHHHQVGKLLVQHPYTKAVGFTGSFTGGKQLFDWANERPQPIPVFAEMSSVNPVFLLPEKLSLDATSIAAMYASSITQSVGQFCTNPGLILGIEGKPLEQFAEELAKRMAATEPAKMLHAGIADAYRQKRAEMLQHQEVQCLAAATEPTPADPLLGCATLATTTGSQFLNNHQLHKEVFGPFSLLVRCKDAEEMLAIAQQLEGQLTATLMATPDDLQQFSELKEAVTNLCGRLILNGVPTGVEVCKSMMHGGPFPATTDSRFSAVGADAIKRFARPLCFQNWPDDLLPDALKNANPLGLWRTINNRLTKDPVFM